MRRGTSVERWTLEISPAPTSSPTCPSFSTRGAKQVFLSCAGEGEMGLPRPRPGAVNDGCFNRGGKGRRWSRSRKKIKAARVNFTGLLFIIFCSLQLTLSELTMTTLLDRFLSLSLSLSLWLSHIKTAQKYKANNIFIIFCREQVNYCCSLFAMYVRNALYLCCLSSSLPEHLLSRWLIVPAGMHPLDLHRTSK